MGTKIETINSIRLELGLQPMGNSLQGEGKMFTEKKIQVLDTSVFREGHLISLMVLGYDKFVRTLDDSYLVNGIIHYACDNYFTFFNSEGEKKKVDVESIFKGDGTDGPQTRYKILGIAHKIERSV